MLAAPPGEKTERRRSTLLDDAHDFEMTLAKAEVAGSVAPDSSTPIRTSAKDVLTAIQGRARIFVRSFCFNAIVLANILVGAALVGLETDYPELLGSGYVRIEAISVLIYVSEMITRFAADMNPLKTLRDPWMRVDVVVCLLLTASFLLTATSFLEVEGSDSPGLLFPLRMVKVVRSILVIRIAILVEGLAKFIECLWSAMVTMSWAMYLLLLVIYLFAVPYVNTVRTNNCPEEVTEHFPSVPWVMFNFFEYATAEGWVEPARDLELCVPWGPYGILLFLSMTSYGILNVAMAVIVDGGLSGMGLLDDQGAQRDFRKLGSI